MMAPPSLPTTGFFPITGIQAGLDPNATDPLRKVPQRMDLDDWYLSTETVHVNQRALFFPAFKNFSEASPEDKFSYFQLAGIHGFPIVPWDETVGEAGTRWSYCHHGETTFATWHRPYLMLFEQVIYEYMKDYARNNFSGQDLEQLLQAADQWRLPYWDWAAKKPDPTDSTIPWNYNLPQAFLTDTVKIRLPSGDVSGFPNALFRFRMPGDLTMGDSRIPRTLRVPNLSGDGAIYPWAVTRSTSRYVSEVGITQAWIDGVQNNTEVVKTLRDEKIEKPDGTGGGVVNESLRDAFGRLFSISSFEDFSSTQPFQLGLEGAVYHNCEGLHNVMHVWIGGPETRPSPERYVLQGQMSQPPVSSFDPIFWFHHCNVDRTIAIWQTLHDQSWFDATRNPFSAGNVAGRNLRPFHRDVNGTYWTSDTVRQLAPLGYTYPTLDKQPYIKDGVYNVQEHLSAINLEINEKYGSARAAAIKMALTADPGQEEGEGGGLALGSLSHLLAAVAPEESERDRTVNDYAVNILYEKMGLQGGRTFTIHVFVGKVPDGNLPFDFHDPEGSLVGQVFNFTSTEDGAVGEDGESGSGCDNCAAQATNRTLATGRVVLTNALITRWKNQLTHTPEPGVEGPTVLASMEPNDVVPFLAANLHWRITADSGLLSIEQVPSVKVAVVVGKADHFADATKLSRYYDYRPAYQVTEGKPGGVGREDGLYPAGSEWQPS